MSDEINEIEDYRKQDIEKVKVTYKKVFYREMWVNKKFPFAKKWLEKNDKEWLKKNLDYNSMNETFYNNKK